MKIRNGILITWSPYLDLTADIETLEKSFRLPFPTGKVLERTSDTLKRASEVMTDYYKVVEGINFINIYDVYGNMVSATKSADEWVTGEETVVKEGPTVYLIRNILKDKIDPQRIWTEKDRSDDLLEFVNSLDLKNIDHINTLIRVFNKLGKIPVSDTFDKYVRIVDRHNTFLKGSKKRDALYNFISIKSRFISLSPINLIQSLSGIDLTTDTQKEIVKSEEFNRLSETADKANADSIYSRMKVLILTLSGKLNVGIVASALKVFETMSLFVYNVLAEGTATLQKDLLTDITINGHHIQMLANAYAKNIDTVKDEDVKNALKNVNNLLDAFLLLSGLLSLATDNAKDPTLAKYNAGPKMIGCYTAGLALGLSMEEIASLLISDTGIILNDLLFGDSFNPEVLKFNSLDSAIRYILDPPYLRTKSLDEASYKELGKVLLNIGLVDSSEKYGADDLTGALKDPLKRRKMLRLARYILGKEVSKSTNIEIAKRRIYEIKHGKTYVKWNRFEGRFVEQIKELENKAERTTQEQKKLDNLKKYQLEYQDAKRLLESYRNYLDNQDSEDAAQAAREIKSLLKSEDLLEETFKGETTLKSNKVITDFFKSLFNWADYRQIIENDGWKISDIKKLNDFNAVMGDLRFVLALNQGLPNLIQDLLNFIRQFRKILVNAINRSEISKEEFAEIKELNKKFNFEDPLWIDLHSFLYDRVYSNAVVEAYSKTNQGINIMAAMLNVPHYRGYLKVMDLLYEGAKSVSVVYREQARLTDKILPKLNLYTKVKVDLFERTLTPIIFSRINSNFLLSKQIKYRIPKFKIKKGNLIKEDGFQTIKLGTKEGNEKFTLFMLNYIYPELLKKYGDNYFIQSLVLRAYTFNPDHNVTINIAKPLLYNMLNPQENVEFNKIKRGLADLNGKQLYGHSIVTALFYYNLIAYNNLPGVSSLTDLFEDIIVYDLNEAVRAYLEYLYYLDRSEVLLFTDQEDDYLMRLLAPVVTLYEDVSKYPYMYILNPETLKYVLMLLKVLESSTGVEGYDDDEYNWDASGFIEGEYGAELEDEGYMNTSSESFEEIYKKLNILPANTFISPASNLALENQVLANAYSILDEIKQLSESGETKDTILKSLEDKIIIVNKKPIKVSEFLEKYKTTSENLFTLKLVMRRDGTKYYTLDLILLMKNIEFYTNNC